MLFAIDIGNTQTVIGLYDLEPDDAHNVGRRLADTHLLDHWRVATNAERTADEQALVIQEFLGFHGFSFDDDIAGIVVCSSVPRVTGALRRMSERYFGSAAVVIGSFQSLANEVDAEGADRHGIQVVRRISGGGAMFIEPGNTITYSLTVPTSLVEGLSFEQSYAFLDDWVLGALNELGIKATYVPLNDIASDEGHWARAKQHYQRAIEVREHGCGRGKGNLMFARAATVEHTDIQILSGVPQIVVRFTIDDDVDARFVAGAMKYAVSRVAATGAGRLLLRRGGRWIPV